MSEYKRQIVVGAVTAVVIALVLAGGVSYLFPFQPTGGQSSTTTSAFNPSTTTATSSYSESKSSTTTKTTDNIPSTITTTTVTTTPATAPSLTTVTITMTETKATATVTVGQILTTTTVITEQIQVTDIYAINANQITLNAINVGNVKETLTSILVNGEPLSSFNGGISNPSLPVAIEPGTSQTITLTFSSQLKSGTYYITFNTEVG
jgi:hypothetical protein